MFSLKSLCSRPGGPQERGVCSSQVPTSLCRVSVPASIAASPRLRQPETPRARNPSGRPRSSSPTALVSTAWIAAMVSSSTCDSRAPISGRCASSARQMFADHQPRPIFDDLKALADDRRIIAQMQPARDERQRVRQPRQNAELARHVVGPGGQFPHRRPAQHGRLAIEVNEVVEVGQPPGELPRRRLRVQPMAMRGEMRAAPPPSPTGRSRRRTAGRFRASRFLLLCC